VPNYTLVNGLLRFKGKLINGDKTDLKKQLMESFHTSAFGGHSGERATLKRIQLFFLAQNAAASEEFVKECPVCQKNKSENVPYPGLLQPLPILEMAWSHISMDFIEGLPKS